MIKKLSLFVLCVSVAFVFYGCGQTVSSTATTTSTTLGTSTTTTSTTTTTIPATQITGTAIVSNADATKMGLSLTSSSLSIDKINSLAARGVIQPLALTSGTVTLCTLDAVGNYVSTGVSTTLASDGTYSLSLPVPTSNSLYYVKITKENAGKILEIISTAYLAASAQTASSDASVTTTLIAETISKIVNELSTNEVDPRMVNDIRTILTNIIGTLVANGDLKSPSSVRDNTSTANQDLEKVVIALMKSGSAEDIIDALKLNIEASKGSGDLVSATAFIREVFGVIAGSPDNVPDTAITALSLAYSSGETTTIAQLVGAINGAGRNASGEPITLTVATSEIVTQVNNQLSALYANLASGSGSIPKVLFAVFPPATKDSVYPVQSSTVFTVPQIMVIVQNIMGSNLSFDPFTMMQNLAIYELPASAQIMHSEIRVMNYYSPGTSEGTETLQSYLDIYHPSGNSALAGATARLTYTTTTGAQAYVNYTSKQGSPGMGKAYSISPWGEGGSTGEVISNFQKASGVCTIEVTVPGTPTSILTREVTLNYFNMASSKPTLQVPKETADFSEITEIATGTSPIFMWTESTNFTVPSGYLLKYAINLSPIGTQEGANTFIYNSWDTHNFVTGNSFPLPSSVTLTSEVQYWLSVIPVVVNNQDIPVSEGPMAGATFIARDSGSMTTATTSFEITGIVTATASDTNLKVGIFKVNDSTFVQGNLITPEVLGTITGSTFSISWTPGTLSALRGYGIEVIAWNDTENDGFITIGGQTLAGDPASFSRKHIGYWGGSLSVYNDATGLDSPLKDSLTGFNCDLTYGGVRLSSIKNSVVKFLKKIS